MSKDIFKLIWLDYKILVVPMCKQKGEFMKTKKPIYEILKVQ